MPTDTFDRLSKDLPLSKETEMLLDERYKSFLEDPNQGRPWNEVKKEIRDSVPTPGTNSYIGKQYKSHASQKQNYPN